MKRIKLFGLLIVIGLLASVGQSQNLVGSEYVNVALTSQIQAIKIKINTKSLLQLIATDQGFTLPPKPKLWLPGALPGLFILNQYNGVFTNVDTNIFNITLVTNIVNYQIKQTANTYLETVSAPTVLLLNYSGASVSFTLTCVGDYKFNNSVNSMMPTDNASLLTSFSGTCVGYGTYNGQTMVIKGTLTGKYSSRYTTDEDGGEPSFP